MAWILLEGLDRSGKSTVAEIYKKKGFEVVHMSAPSKKYFQPGYSGPSYLEEIVDMYSIYNGKDVLFDRTPYGECIWPDIYNRQALLNDDDFEYLQRLEYNNDAVKILMHDKNTEAHWQRCVDNKEPLTRLQFVQAGRLYEDLARKFNFEKHQLGDFADEQSVGESSDEREIGGDVDTSGDVGQSTDKQLNKSTEHGRSNGASSLEKKLERANAIRSLLRAPIVKKKGEVFDELEENIKSFLEKELESIFTEPKKDDFTQEEVQILKLYAQRIKEKLG